MKRFFYFLAIIIAGFLGYCTVHNTAAPLDFAYPLPLSIDLAAGFGEVREDHFHMGVDMRTGGRENVPVLAAAEGYVSRMSVSEGGYGNALYVTHPSGTTTLYGHLNKFSPPLQQYLLDHQLISKKWEQDLELPRHLFMVKKKEQIAWSGNTGHSQGPHLHFEIQQTATGERLNPLTTGITGKDAVSPIIKGIYWYDRRFSIYKSSSNYLDDTKIKKSESFTINSPLVSFGIEAEDRIGDSRFTLGIYKAELYLDGSLKYRFILDKIGEKDTRYVNACIDYEKMQVEGKRIQYLFRLPGNELPAYRSFSRPGLLNIGDDKDHHIKIVVYDASFNTDSVSFSVSFFNDLKADYREKKAIEVVPHKSKIIHGQFSSVYFKKNTFYDTVPIIFSEEAAKSSEAVSPLIRVEGIGVPVHDSYKVSVRSSLSMDDPLRKRTVMVLNTISGDQVSAGKWRGNLMEGEFNTLGTVRLVIDSKPPTVRIKYNTQEKKSILEVLCNDDLGEVKNFNAEVDGKWIPFSKKGNIYTCTTVFNKSIKHNVKVTVSDVAGNTTTQIFDF